jgi:hypothetical protein
MVKTRQKQHYIAPVTFFCVFEGRDNNLGKMTFEGVSILCELRLALFFASEK